MNKKIWLSPPHISGNGQKYIREVFDTNWVAPLGLNVTDFENSLQAYLGENNYVAALNSGTAAIHLALLMAGITQEDEVLCQSFTFSATANPILYLGAIPVFIDSEKETWNMSPKVLEKAITDRLAKGKKPKAVIAVNSYGMPAKWDRLAVIAKKYSLVLIEDAASALGSKVNGQKCGTFGDFGIFSFNGNKIITTLGGGALITSSEKQKEKAIFFATQSRDNAPHYQHSEIGYNYRMSNILAGIGRGQMKLLASRLTARRANFKFYKTELAEITTLQFLEEPTGFYSNQWLSCIMTPSFEIREKIRLGLEQQNIESRPLWKPMHRQPIFDKYPSYLNGISDNLFEKGLCLPSGSNLTEADLERIVTDIKALIQ